MGRMQPLYDDRVPCPGTVTLKGALTIGGAGAISAQQGMALAGATFVKNAAAGRYDITLHRGFKRILGGGASVVHPAAGTVPTLADGNQVFLQGVPATTFAVPPTTGVTETGYCLQATRTDTQAAANPTSGVTIVWWLDVADA